MTSPRAIDTHAHIFHRQLPMPDLRRAPSGYDATAEDFLRHLGAHQFSHGVLVQPSFLGTDNSFIEQALHRHPRRLRGVAVVGCDTSASELERLNAAGFVGLRLNLIGLLTPALASDPWKSLLQRVRDLGWFVQIHQEAHLLEPVLEPLLRAGLPIVVDHFGRPDATQGMLAPGFAYLMGLGDTRQVWIKISAAYRNGPPGVAESFAAQAIPLIRHRFGLSRMLWGSDWPHTRFEDTQTYAQARKQLDEWLPDLRDRSIVLWETPQALFRFPDVD
jgi:predicted TIM-barrel fold metal-dependent hydrolase